MSTRFAVASAVATRDYLGPEPTDPAAHRTLLPEGIVHAFRLGGLQTACGVPAGELTAFPGLDFETADFLSRCTACLAALRTH